MLKYLILLIVIILAAGAGYLALFPVQVPSEPVVIPVPNEQLLQQE